jgi:OOP family OmpA-OmpF porin
MSKINNIIISVLIGISSFMLFACSSNMKKANIPNTANPQEEIAKLDAEIGQAVLSNIDIIAPKEYTDSKKWLEEAKADQRSQQKQEEILDDVRYSRGALEKAYQISENRAQYASGLLESRQAAFKAGASQFSEISADLKRLDKSVASNAGDLKGVETETLSEWQGLYVDLERRATILTHLGDTQAIFNGTKKDGAEKMAPQTYKKADLALKNAESVISANVRNSDGFRDAVETAKTETALLVEVSQTIKQNGNELSEPAALKMVSQSRQIKNLSTNLSVSEARNAVNTEMLNEENQNLSDELEGEKQARSSANVRIEIQKAMDAARNEFTSDEAETYQMGENLLIRLKQMNFASGRADLPKESLAVLAKVANVAKSMNAAEIKVEGHTDSTGSVDLNKTLSEKRAASVATYFKTSDLESVTSAGYGFQKPIATNKSKTGRALNRRVDIIITPDASTAIE